MEPPSLSGAGSHEPITKGDTAEPFSQAGSSSGKIKLRKGKTTSEQYEGEMRKEVSETSAEIRVREGREEVEVLEAPEQRFSWSLWSRSPHCSLWRTPQQSKGAVSE